MRTLIAVPCMDMCHTEFLRALLSLEVTGEAQYTFAQSSLIYDARNMLAGIAEDGDFDRVLWLDSDMTFPPSLFKRMHEHLDMGKELVSGLYFGRKPPFGPIIYKDCCVTNEGPFPSPHAESFDDYPRDEIFPITACGFGAVMMTVDLIRRVHERFGAPFTPMGGFGEDLSFCLRAKELGAELWCDSSIKCGHVGLATYSEETFFAMRSSPSKNSGGI